MYVCFHFPSRLIWKETTGPEIWEQTEGTVDAFVTAAGTGGTLAGCSKFLKEKNNNVKCFAIDPQGTGNCTPRSNQLINQPGIKFILEGDKVEIVLKTEEDKAKPSRFNTASILEGIGSGRLYAALPHAVLDGAFQGDDQVALEMVQYLLKKEGLFIGNSFFLNFSNLHFRRLCWT